METKDKDNDNGDNIESHYLTSGMNRIMMMILTLMMHLEEGEYH